MKCFLSLLLGVFAFTSNVEAIVIRHDVRDQHYLKLGAEYSPSVAYIDGCAGTVIAPDWLLTAAHCVVGRERFLFRVKHLNKSYRIASIFVHPDFDKQNDEIYDVALIQLKEPIVDGKPAKLYRDTEENGKPVVFVGKGTFGNGKDGLIRDDFKERGATNTVAETTKHVIGFRFDSPETATDFEGISARGDSGGPAFMVVGSELYVVGISSYQDGKGVSEGHYGVWEYYYARVSSVYPWLVSVIESTEVASVPEHAVIDAIKSNNISALEKAINDGVINNQYIINEAFYQTIVLNRVKHAKLLISSGAAPEKASVKDVSLFEFALLGNRKRYFQMLLNEVANKKILHSPESPILALAILNYASDRNLKVMIRTLVDQGANINAKTSSGDTALTIAGWDTNDLALITQLVENGADVNVQNNNGDSPLMDAAYLGKLSILQYLLESGANPSLQNNRGFTALDRAKNKKTRNLIAAYVD